MLVLSVAYWIATLLVTVTGAPPIFLRIVQVILAVILLLYVLSFLSGSGHTFYRWR